MFASLTQASFLKLFPGAMRLGGVAALWAMAWCVAAQGDVNLTEGVDAENLDAVAFIPIADMLANTANDLASWYDEEEDQTYLLVGCDNGTAFFKMLPGARPLYMGKLPTQSVPSLWRDIKVVHDHAYVVSEAPGHGMQVLALNALREWNPVNGPVAWQPDTVVSSPSTAHNIVAFEERSTVIQVGSNFVSGGAVLFDVSVPGEPVLVGAAGEWGSFHDAQALTYNGPDVEHLGKDLLFAAGSGKLWVLDITDPTDITLVSSASYPGAHFSHQVWVSDTHDHAFLGDELDETSEGTPTRTIVFDLTDLDAPSVAEVYEAPTPASDHNQYTHGEWLFQSNYRAGLRMLSDAWPASPVLTERGHFDPLDETDAAGFQGAWSHVILEEEGVLAFTSIEQGLWVVRPRFARLNNVAITGCQASAEPEPNAWSMTLVVDAGWAFPVEVEVQGVVLVPGQTGSWILEEPGSVLMFFEAWGVPGVQPHVKLTSQRSTWSLNILTPDALWPAHYADDDGDGYGNPNMPVWGCGEVPGTSLLPLDCQDWNPNTYPSAPELCDGWNNDCDDEVDEGTSQLTWYLDADGDGFGSNVAPVAYSCTALNQRVLISGDCNDNEASMYPGAPALADGMDNNCDGAIEDSELNPCMGDFDLDGARTINDMLHLLSSFGCELGCTASLNAFDSVYTDDLLLWLGVFGLDCD
jgi:choice-of-anchor B domain-containing protein